MKSKSLKLFSILAMAISVTSCGYNTIQKQDEDVNAALSEVNNQYQRRADLIPNLVSVVKGYATHERETLQSVIEARSKVAGIKVDKGLLDNPEQFKRYQEAQDQLSGSLSRLMMITESYPNLKANEGFRDLQAQLEGTENRITVARNRYIKSVQSYNTFIRQFPTVITAKIIHAEVKPNFSTITPNSDRAPQISFDKH